MTNKKIDQIHSKVMNLTNASKNLSLCNAYIDQALMNFSYETMTKKDQSLYFAALVVMVEKFNTIRGR